MKPGDQLHSQYSELCKNCIPPRVFEGKKIPDFWPYHDSAITMQMMGSISPIIRLALWHFSWKRSVWCDCCFSFRNQRGLFVKMCCPLQMSVSPTTKKGGQIILSDVSVLH